VFKDAFIFQIEDYQAKWPVPLNVLTKAWVCGFSHTGTEGPNLSWGWIFFCCESGVLSGRGLCDGLITRPEKSYRLRCVWVWSWRFDNEEALVHRGAVAP